jgi:WD40 repeat protein/predicted Ser/Thr protein kinase
MAGFPGRPDPAGPADSRLLERSVTIPQDSSDGGAQLLLGKKLLEKGLITPDQLREALVERARHVASGDRNATPLGGILVSKGFLTDAQLLDALNERGPNGAAGPPGIGNTATLSPVGLPGEGAAAGGGRPSVRLPSIEAAAATQTRLGKYAIQGELGRGGMGVVYDALDTQLNRKVALKLMLANPNMDPKDRQLEVDRFIQEAQLSAKLKHPNIVTVYEAGLLDGRQYLAMELIEGSSFSDWRRGAPLRDQIAVVRDVALAVHHAHEQGILHRDLKPRNILVGPGNRPCVTDFGLAKSLGKNVNLSLTGSGAVVGTPAYMSPEQAQGAERVDWRTDIYSLGVILYEVMTGRTPFTGESPIEILMKVVKDPVPPPLEIAEANGATGLDKAIENICLKALARKDKDRYVTAQAFADDLTKWLAGEQVKVVLPRVRRPLPNLKLVAGVLLILGGAGAGVAWYLGRPVPVSVRADLEAGARALAEGRIDDALFAFQKAQEKEPENAAAKKGIQDVQAARKAAREKQEAETRRTLEQTLKKLEQALQDVVIKTNQQEAAPSETQKAILEQERKKALEFARGLQEEADRVKKLLGIKAPEVKPADSSASESEWEKAKILLPMMDPLRHAVRGAWALQNQMLLSDRSARARIEVPMKPPEEYDLRLVFSRKGGSGAVMVVLVGLGRTFGLEVGDEEQGSGGLTKLASDKEGARVAPSTLDNDRNYTVEVQVRRDGVQAFLDGKPLCSLKTDYSDIALPADWKLANVGILGLGSHGSPTLFQRLDLLEITGTHRRPTPPPPPLLTSTPIPFGSVKSGLIGEYSFGTWGGLRACRRIDPEISFEWKEDPAWEGGTRDAFSARWTGYLHVPRAGEYGFTIRTDDHVRLEIDGFQVLALQPTRGGAPPLSLVQLEEGFHRFLLDYSHEAYLAGVRLLWSEGGESSPVPVPPKAFYHSESEFEALSAPPIPEYIDTLKGHGSSVSAVAFRPDSQVLATGSEDRRAKFWDVPKHRELGHVALHPSGVISLAWSPDGKQLATGAWDFRVRLWDAATGTEVRSLPGHTAFVQSVAFSPDGRTLASGSGDGTIRLWELGGVRPARILSAHRNGVEAVAWSPDGRRLATAGLDRVVRIWDPVQEKELGLLRGHVDGVSGIAWSPDGRRLATAGWDDTLRYWDVASGKETRRVAAHGSETVAVAWSPDGKVVATGGADALVKLWHADSGVLIRVYPGHTGRVISVAFSPDGSRLATGSFDGTARLWNVGGR